MQLALHPRQKPKAFTQSKRTPLSAAFMFLSAANVLQLPQPCYFFLLLRQAADGADVSASNTDPKLLRKLRQQQLQQKFRREMEAKKLLHKLEQAKPEEVEVAVGRRSTGGRLQATGKSVINEVFLEEKLIDFT